MDNVWLVWHTHYGHPSLVAICADESTTDKVVVEICWDISVVHGGGVSFDQELGATTILTSTGERIHWERRTVRRSTKSQEDDGS